MGDNRRIDLIAGPPACVACAEVGEVVHLLSTDNARAHRVHTRHTCARTGLSTAVQVLADGAHLTLESHVLAHELGDLLDRMQRCRVVAPTEGAADHRER
jgi:hypothetical protein